MGMGPFFTLHSELDREGPGDRGTLDWAMDLAGVAADARVLDAACGPGADLPGLLDRLPRGQVVAVDKHAPFVAAARARVGDDPRLDARVGDMAAPEGVFDLIWCSSALYFLGIEAGLRQWRAALRDGGIVAFSDAIWLGCDRPAAAVANWAEYPAMADTAGVLAQVRSAGYQVLGRRMMPDAAWEAYYSPLDRRVAQLRAATPDDAALSAVLDEAEAEAACWRAHRDVFGYLMVVARKT